MNKQETEHKDGKQIAIDIDGMVILSDSVCNDDNEVCDICKLRFRCYAFQDLVLKLEEIWPRKTSPTLFPLGVLIDQLLTSNKRS